MLPTAMTEGYTQSALHVIQCFALYAKPGYALYRVPLSIVSSPSPGYCLLCSALLLCSNYLEWIRQSIPGIILSIGALCLLWVISGKSMDHQSSDSSKQVWERWWRRVKFDQEIRLDGLLAPAAVARPRAIASIASPDFTLSYLFYFEALLNK